MSELVKTERRSESEELGDIVMILQGGEIIIHSYLLTPTLYEGRITMQNHLQTKESIPAGLAFACDGLCADAGI